MLQPLLYTMPPNVFDPIVCIDSGVGGLTIFDAVRKQLPFWPLIYCFDNAAFPYGNKNKRTLVERASFCINKLMRKVNPSLIIVACNTASTIVLPALRSQWNIPIVGVVPAIKTAAQASVNRCIGLLATPGTAQREYTEHLMSTYAKDCQVICVGSSQLVQIAEEKLQGKSVSLSQIKEILLPFIEAAVVPDYIVLGCTHFPLLVNELHDCLASVGSRLVDSGEAIARRVAYLLTKEVVNGNNNSAIAQKHLTFCTQTKNVIFSQAFLSSLSGRNLSHPILLD